MMYPAELTAPMKLALTEKGFKDLETSAQVEALLSSEGTILVVINSVCGCAAGAARPGAIAALDLAHHKPDVLSTVFAGVDQEATEKVREYLLPYPPSSPSVALFKDGEPLHFLERHHIEGRSAEVIAEHLAAVFEEFCSPR